MKALRISTLILVLGICLTAFQNCAESIDLSSYNVSSQTSIPRISNQSVSGAVEENSNLRLFIEVQNATNYTVLWKKDNVDISGAPELTLSINPVRMADAGDYQAFVTVTTDTATVQISSQIITVTVTPDPNMRVFNDPSVTIGNANYFLLYNAQDTVTNREAMLNSFCKIQVGPNSTLVSYLTGTSPTITTRYVYFNGGSSCLASQFATGVAGTSPNLLCGIFYSPGVSFIHYNSVTCKP